MKPNLTKDQRKRLFLLARLLDRVPRRRFDMQTWFGGEFIFKSIPQAVRTLIEHPCGSTGCAIGHGLSSPAIAGNCRTPLSLIRSLGFSSHDFSEIYGRIPTIATQLFGPQRSVGPRTVANDIRKYLRDGTLPRK